MCGFIFYRSPLALDKYVLDYELSKINWRGPDFSSSIVFDDYKTYLGHNRLSIQDLNDRSNQPYISQCGRFVILFNGEIYNHLDIRENLSLKCVTTSDTETILAGYVKCGNKIWSLLDGMFSVVIYDTLRKSWVAARDPFGIKPLYYSRPSVDEAIFASESSSIQSIIGSLLDSQSLEEWKILRRPVPGFTFYKNIFELKPGEYIESHSLYPTKYYIRPEEPNNFNYKHFDFLIRDEVFKHQPNDVKYSSLISSGIDSTIISTICDYCRLYTVGTYENNEFFGANQSANVIGKPLVTLTVSLDLIRETWYKLIEMKREPLFVPNEALIHLVCQSMCSDEKVVLTGEGADELFFGYDNIIRKYLGLTRRDFNIEIFLRNYSYTKIQEQIPQRLLDYCLNLYEGLEPIEFIEDFFLDIHLTTLLRRMDFASMTASKEARVPFVCKSLFEYLYRIPTFFKINEHQSKIPLYSMANRLGLSFMSSRKKQAFNVRNATNGNRVSEYNDFQYLNLKALKWL